MGCKICGRNSCTESFHRIEEQEEHDKAGADMAVDLLAQNSALRTEKEKLKFALQTIAKTEGATVSNLKCVAEQALKD
jgi:hypothetical protein